MEANSIVIYGETCSGKSTLGVSLSSTLGGSYISFGDIKRDEIAQKTNLGLLVNGFVEAGRPIPADVAHSLIAGHIRSGLNIISGYPIAVSELRFLLQASHFLGFIVLSIGEDAILSRFSLRRECVRCHRTGVVGDICPVHGTEMAMRPDISPEHLLRRRELYHKRISPFLSSEALAGLPRLDLDSGVLSPQQLSDRAAQWLRVLLSNGGRREGYG